MFLGNLIRLAFFNWTTSVIVISVPLFGIALAYLANRQGWKLPNSWRRPGCYLSWVPILSLSNDRKDKRIVSKNVRNGKNRKKSRAFVKILVKSAAVSQESTKPDCTGSTKADYAGSIKTDYSSSSLSSDQDALDFDQSNDNFSSEEKDLMVLASMRSTHKKPSSTIGAKRTKTDRSKSGIATEEVVSPVFSKVHTEEDNNDSWSSIPTKQDEVLALMKNRIQALTNQIDSLTSSLVGKEKEAEVAAIKSKDLEKQIKDHLRSSQVRIAALEGEINGLRLENRQVSTKLDSLKSIEENVCNAEAENRQLLIVINDSKGKIESLTNSINQYQEQLADKESKLNGVQENCQQLKLIINELEQFKEQYTLVKAQNDLKGERILNLEYELQEANELVQSINAEKNKVSGELEATIDDLRKQLLEADNIQASKLTQLQNIVKISEEEQATVQAALADAYDNVKIKEQEIIKMKQESESLKQELEQMIACERDRNIVAENRIKELEEEVKIFEKTYQEACLTISKLEEVKAGGEEKINSLENKIEELIHRSQDRTEQQDNSAAYKEELEKTKKDMEAIKKKFADVLHQFSTIRKERDEAVVAREQLIKDSETSLATEKMMKLENEKLKETLAVSNQYVESILSELTVLKEGKNI